jgi:hypothetical protein
MALFAMRKYVKECIFAVVLEYEQCAHSGHPELEQADVQFPTSEHRRTPKSAMLFGNRTDPMPRKLPSIWADQFVTVPSL